MTCSAVHFKPAQRVNEHAHTQELRHLEERHFIKQNTAQTSEGELCFHLKREKKVIFKHNQTKEKEFCRHSNDGNSFCRRLKQNMTSRTDCGNFKIKADHSPLRPTFTRMEERKEDHAHSGSFCWNFTGRTLKAVQLQISIFRMLSNRDASITQSDSPPRLLPL